MATKRQIPLGISSERSADERLRRAVSFRDELRRRRSVRDFADRPISRAVIEASLEAAGSAPSGANMQPWHFVVVTDPAVKRRIRAAAESEERAFYAGRAGTEWLGALADLGTDWQKPFLEIAPCLIAVFAQSCGVGPDGRKVKHYYVRESVGIATGLLIAALHHAGLALSPYRPSRPGFLNEILDHPENERPFVVLVVGHPAAGATVPDIEKKGLGKIATFM